MKNLLIIVLSISIGFLSFNKSDKEKFHIKTDSIRTFIVDGYPISNLLLKGNYNKKVSGSIVAFDQAWFRNDTLKQTIVFGLYTDYHRLVTYHFFNDTIPIELISQMELHDENGSLATEEEKRKNLKGLINQSKQIAKNYFTTNKGFRLGDKKEKSLKMYGSPDKITTYNGIEKYEWAFLGDILYDGKVNLKGKPLAYTSYGHTVTMYFQNNHLIAMILFNDIP